MPDPPPLQFCAQTQSLKSGGPQMGTPMPGRMPGQELPDLSAGGGAALPPRVAAVARKVDAAVAEAVVTALLKIALDEKGPVDGGAGKGTAATPSKAAATPIPKSKADKAKAAAAAATAAARGVLSSLSEEQLPSADRAQHEPKLAEIEQAASTGAAFTEAMARAPAWVSSILSSAHAVIDQNMPPLMAHLHTIIRDGVAAAVRSLQAKAPTGGAGGAVTEADAAKKGAGVLATLHAAVDNVQMQFVVGLRASVPPGVASQLGKPLLDALCETVVGDRCDKLRGLSSEAEIASRVWEEVRIVQDFIGSVSTGGPQAWLLSLIRQESHVSLPEALKDFIETHIADHLDPYIDGDVTSPEEERGTSPLHMQLCKAYAAAHGRELPAPPEVVLALYVKHAVCKANATQCFSDLVMGQGRLPIPGAPQERHCTALGKALEAAVRKDFVYDGASHTKIQGVAISAELITELARNHSDLLFVDHQKNAERLAEANRLGELGRKEEMKRIFGIEVP